MLNTPLPHSCPLPTSKGPRPSSKPLTLLLRLHIRDGEPGLALPTAHPHNAQRLEIGEVWEQNRQCPGHVTPGRFLNLSSLLQMEASG